ncbi:hypothetical protein EUGRSUZ_E03185 [Eucalyptus grandis]|uniref:Uncharacterized protein n=2 Tax=Eucalyptus grandis TaxID=71139 RepID=A0ACC3KY41_EUCGR|nr:hypothetical protein EUGRSUZ_E03185 [Eucalyptus grandis]
MEVAQMVESEKIILPIFYGVKPCVVQYRQGTYGTAFIKHEGRRDAETITKWKNALANIAEILGFELEDVDKGCHKFLKNVVSELRKHLRTDEQRLPIDLVGINRDVRDMMKKLGVSYENGRVVEGQKTIGKCVVAVCGLPGVGKTTLAKVVYNKISHLFDGCSFLENVRDNVEQYGVVSLQKKLIRDFNRREHPEVKTSNEGSTLIERLFRTRRVLVVLDDVDHFNQIKPLAEALTWFGLGSRIILTIRNRNVIEGYEDGEIKEHKVLPMNDENYGSLPKDIISAVGNLPLSIKTVALYLCRKERKNESIWRETLQLLEREPGKDIKDLLMKSYNLLEEKTKQIFLDIACFFTEVEKTIPFCMWEVCESRPNRGVDELQNVFFLEVKENKFWMHNQLKVLGREIVENENIISPGERSRLWDYRDVQMTLSKSKGTEKVKALRVTLKYEDEQEIDCFHCEKFHRLSNLRFLDLDCADIEGNPKSLLPKLVWLDWRGCNKISKLFAFNIQKLVILSLCSSPIRMNLRDWKRLMQEAKRLKVLNLKGCLWIIASLEFPTSISLEHLILEGCPLLLPTYHESIFSSENLVTLNIKNCKYIRDLPQALYSLKVLRELLIDGTKIVSLHFMEGSLPALEILSACKCELLKEVTDSIGVLKKLQKLTLRSCKHLGGLPHSMGQLVQLKEMDLSYTSINKLPSSFKDLKNLEVLKMVCISIKEFPEAIKILGKLEELDFTHCTRMAGDCDIRGLSSMRILRLKNTKISRMFAKDYGQFDILDLDDGVLELDDGVDMQMVS